LLGQRQEAWLDGQFRQAKRAGATWQVIAQQTLLGQRDFLRGEGQQFWNDGWDGYAPARRRLTQSLATHHVPNPVVLGGDVHENWVGHVKADYARPDSANVGVEFCGTSVTSRSGNSSKAPDWLAENPHFVFADTERKGYGVVDFTPQRIITRLQVVDNLAQPVSRIETLARFEVEAGRSVVNRL
jgi:alkaline phosphatase D